ncbi:unnamed protein product, partial [Allacma fusca]
IIYNKLLKVLP